MKAADEEDIREVLGRKLDASELGKYENLDEIAPAVEAAALRIATPGRDILGSKYLRLRVPSANYFEAKLTLSPADFPRMASSRPSTRFAEPTS